MKFQNLYQELKTINSKKAKQASKDFVFQPFTGPPLSMTEKIKKAKKETGSDNVIMYRVDEEEDFDDAGNIKKEKGDIRFFSLISSGMMIVQFNKVLGSPNKDFPNDFPKPHYELHYGVNGKISTEASGTETFGVMQSIIDWVKENKILNGKVISFEGALTPDEEKEPESDKPSKRARVFRMKLKREGIPFKTFKNFTVFKV